MKYKLPVLILAILIISVPLLGANPTLISGASDVKLPAGTQVDWSVVDMRGSVPYVTAPRPFPVSGEQLQALRGTALGEIVAQTMEKAKAAGVGQAGPAKLVGWPRVRALALLVYFPVVETAECAPVPPQFFIQSVDANEHFNRMLFSLDYQVPTGSLRDYYRENSYGKFDLIGESRGWYTAPHSYCYYTHNRHDHDAPNAGMGDDPNNSRELVKNLLGLTDPYIDFSVYDNDKDGLVDYLIVIYPGTPYEASPEYTALVGGGAHCFWPHLWAVDDLATADGVKLRQYIILPENMNIGVAARLFAYFLGCIDLYDAAGDWSLMGYAVGPNPGACDCGIPHPNLVVHPEGFWGRTPGHLDAYHKAKLGWGNVVSISKDQLGVEIPQVETYPTIYRLWTDGKTGPEYFLLENRQTGVEQAHFDKHLPGTGLLIWHIDETVPQGDETHWRVGLEQADGLKNLERGNNSGDMGDPYPGKVNPDFVYGASKSNLNLPNREFTDYSKTVDATCWGGFTLPSNTPNSRDYYGKDTFVRVRNISDSGPVMKADLYVESKPDLAVGWTSLAPPKVYLGQKNAAMLKLSLSIPGDHPNPHPVVLRKIRVDETGTSTEDDDVQAVKLYDDTNGSGKFEPDYDSLLTLNDGKGNIVNYLTFYDQTVVLDFSHWNYTISPNQPRNLFIVYDIAGDATLGLTLRAEIRYWSDIFNAFYMTVDAPDSVDPSLFPVISDESTIVEPPDTLFVSREDLAINLVPPGAPPGTAPKVTQGDREVAMLKLKLEVNLNSVTVTAIRIDEHGSSTNDADVSLVKLYEWEDSNGNGQVDPHDPPPGLGDRWTLLNSGKFSSQTVNVDMYPLNYQVVAGTPRYILVVYDISQTATVGEMVGAKLAAEGYVTVAGADVVDPLNFPLVSSIPQIKDKGDTLLISGINLAPQAGVYQGKKDVVMEKLEFVVKVDAVTISSIKVKLTGVVLSDISRIKLYDDPQNNNIIDDVVTELLGSKSVSQDPVTGELYATFPLNYTVTQETPRRILIALDIAPTATVDRQVAVKVHYDSDPTKSDIQIEDNGNPDSPDQIAGSGDIQSGFSTIGPAPPELTVKKGVKEAPGTVEQGALGVVMLQLRLSVNAGSVTLGSLRVDKSGNSKLDSDVSKVYVYKDIGGDGTPDGAPLGEGIFTKNTVFFQNVNYQVTAAEDKYLLIVYDINDTAEVGTTLGAKLVDNTYIQLATSGVVLTSKDGVPLFPIESAMATVEDLADTLRVKRESRDDLISLITEPVEVRQGAEGLIMGRLVVVVLKDWVTVDSIKVDKATTSPSADVTAVKIYDWVDTNENGLIDNHPEDFWTLLGEEKFEDNSVVFTNLNYEVWGTTEVTLPSGVTRGARNILITYDLSPIAGVGNKVAMKLGADCVKLKEPDVVEFVDPSLAQEPVVTSEATIANWLDVLTVTGTSLAPIEVTQGDKNVIMEQLKLTVNSDPIIIKKIKIAKTGTEPMFDPDIMGVKLYDWVDTDKDGKVDPIAEPIEKSEDTFTLLGKAEGKVQLSSETVEIDVLLNSGAYKVSYGEVKYILIVLDIASIAKEGNKLGVRLASKDYVTVSGADTYPTDVSLTNPPIDSTLCGVLNLPDVLSVEGIDLAPDSILRGCKKEVMLQIKLSTNSDPVTVTAIKVGRTGTCLDADVAKVSLYEDTDGDGKIDSGALPMATGSFKDGSVTFEKLDYKVSVRGAYESPPKYQYLLIACDIAANATVGKTVGVILANAGYITVKAPASVSMVKPPIESKKSKIELEDLVAPAVERVSAKDSIYVEVVFNEKVEKTSAETVANYSISPQLTILKAELKIDQKTVLLTTSTQTPGTKYTLTVKNVKDISGNAIAEPGITVTFFAPPTWEVEMGVNLVSLPVIPDLEDPAQVLGITLDAKHWARYDPAIGDYKYYPDDYTKFKPTNTTPGKGFWLKADNDLSIKPPGTVVDVTKSYSISLLPGWNMIGNPYLEDVLWDRSKIGVQTGWQPAIALTEQDPQDPIVRDYLWEWTGTSYTLVYDPTILPGSSKYLKTWYGYWIYAKQGCTLIIPAAVVGKKGELLANRGAVKSRSMPEWCVQLKATAGLAKDEFNVLGVSSISAVVDLKVANPPAAPGGWVDLHFVDSEGSGKLAVDLRKPASGKLVWRLVVETNIPNTDVALVWPDVKAVPKNLNLVLIDEETGCRQYMRTSSAYVFKSGANGALRKFSLEVEQAAGGALRITNLMAVSDKARGSILVSYSLSKAALVDVKITNLLGKPIKVLAAKKFSSVGVNSVYWDGRDLAGRSVPAGVYLCQVLAVTEEKQMARAVRPILIAK